MRPVRLLLAATLIVAGCSGGDDPSGTPAPAPAESSSAPEDAPAADEESESSGDGEADLEDVGEIEVDRGLLSVEITFPADFIGEDDPVAYTDEVAADQGIEWGERTVNPDGSVTVKMSRTEHNRLMDDLRVGFDEALASFPDDSESIKSASANRDYDVFEIVVDRGAFESSMDGFATQFGIALYAGFYAIFNGDDPQETRFEIRYIDEATGEVFETVVSPDDFQE